MKNNQYKPVNNTGLRRILNASKFSWQGLRATYRSEAAFRQECYVGVLALPLSFLLADNVLEWVLLITSFLLVLLTEIINSAIEATVDRLSATNWPVKPKTPARRRLPWPLRLPC